MDYKLDIYKVRKMKRLSLDELARKSGLSKSHLSAVENGKKSPTIRVFMKICTALNVCPLLLIQNDYPCIKKCNLTCTKYD